MIIRLFMSFIAILFPWLILLLEDNPGGAVVALIMQASIIGWPFAAVWALRTQRESRKARNEEKRIAKEKADEEKRKENEKAAEAKREAREKAEEEKRKAEAKGEAEKRTAAASEKVEIIKENPIDKESEQ
ncbi:MAG: hypothetical protein H0U57_08850 [Tatlockia sp.]|nr:hypothetical protein [Tatlockia sp.]